jgi:hypothetical protein
MRIISLLMGQFVIAYENCQSFMRIFTPTCFVIFSIAKSINLLYLLLLCLPIIELDAICATLQMVLWHCMALFVQN